ncbi:MAG: CDP-alcohol phosphatidyltransferase family protein [Candidatus Acidiferrales bacterium]
MQADKPHFVAPPHRGPGVDSIQQGLRAEGGWHIIRATATSARKRATCVHTPDRSGQPLAAGEDRRRPGGHRHPPQPAHPAGTGREYRCRGFLHPRRFRWGAAVIFLAGFLDIADGQVARKQGRVTAFGAFFDSTLDRYSDMMLYLGLLIYYANIGRFLYVVLAIVAMVSSFMVSYSRARAESIIPLCKVGFMERPERVVLLILGGLFNRMAPVLWTIAVLSTLTVTHRIAYTWRETQAGRVLPGLRPPA